jgi:hypothetical protein
VSADGVQLERSGLIRRKRFASSNSSVGERASGRAMAGRGVCWGVGQRGENALLQVWWRFEAGEAAIDLRVLPVLPVAKVVSALGRGVCCSVAVEQVDFMGQFSRRLNDQHVQELRSFSNVILDATCQSQRLTKVVGRYNPSTAMLDNDSE